MQTVVSWTVSVSYASCRQWSAGQSVSCASCRQWSAGQSVSYASCRQWSAGQCLLAVPHASASRQLIDAAPCGVCVFQGDHSNLTNRIPSSRYNRIRQKIKDKYVSSVMRLWLSFNYNDNYFERHNIFKVLYNVLSVPQTVSNMNNPETRAQSSATHGVLVVCSMLYVTSVLQLQRAESAFL